MDIYKLSSGIKFTSYSLPFADNIKMNIERIRHIYKMFGKIYLEFLSIFKTMTFSKVRSIFSAK